MVRGRGAELWTSDGTAAGTHLVRDIGPGAIDGPIPGSLTSILDGQLLLFAASDVASGMQLWISNGTTGGTLPVTSFGVGGRGAVSLGPFLDTGSRVFFAADDGLQGNEPWVFDLNGSGAAFVLNYGHGCSTTPTTVPRIGSTGGLPSPGTTTFAVTLTNAPATTAAFPLVAFTPGSFLLGSGCRQLIGVPYIALPLRFTDPVGDAQIPIGLPNDPSYIGVNLFCQWGVIATPGRLLGAFDLSDGLQAQIGN